jgi:hypothetical protein
MLLLFRPSLTKNQEPIAVAVVLVHAATGLDATVATTATTILGATVDAAAANEQEPIAATVVLGATSATGLGFYVATNNTTGLGAAVATAATNEQEPIVATVVLRTTALLEDMAMVIKPTNRGLEEATKGFEEQDEH